jgi:hypothetical protein
MLYHAVQKKLLGARPRSLGHGPMQADPISSTRRRSSAASQRNCSGGSCVAEPVLTHEGIRLTIQYSNRRLCSKTFVFGTRRRIRQSLRKIDGRKVQLKEGFWPNKRTTELFLRGQSGCKRLGGNTFIAIRSFECKNDFCPPIGIENRRAFTVIICDREARNHRLYRLHRIYRQVTSA